MAVCPDCSREFRTNQGLAGHRRQAHAEGYEPPSPAVSQADVGMLEAGLRSLDDQIGQLLERPVPVPIDAAVMAASIATQVAEILAGQHPAGLCEDDHCSICSQQKMMITDQTIQRIEHRVPGTIAAIANWEERHQPITFANNDGTPASDDEAEKVDDSERQSDDFNRMLGRLATSKAKNYR